MYFGVDPYILHAATSVLWALAHPIHAADSWGMEHERLPLLDETKQTQGHLAQKKGQLDRFLKNWYFSALSFFVK